MNIEMIDPKGLMQDAYLIEGIRIEECRSIFLDWALSVPIEQNARDWIVLLLNLYRSKHPEHPMTLVLQEGLIAQEKPARRGGRKARQPQI